MEAKKISFGFMKTKKQDKPVVTEQREYIESVEENAIKVIGKEITAQAEPLIIPMKPNTLITAERLKEIAEKVESSINEPEHEDEDKNQNEQLKQSENETLDQMAARELLQEAKQQKKTETETLKILVPSAPVIDGQKESSLEDYEAVPIQDFGMAMLRGMGWKPGQETSKYKLPNLRPKGLGLGADKVVTENQKKNASKDNNDKDLAIVKNACVKITSGKYSGCYGKVLSLDEDNGRVMVNIPIKKDTVSLSEFMMHPVSKSEYDKQSKVINADSYEAYKKSEKPVQKRENEGSSSHKSRSADKSDRKESRDKDGRSQKRDNDTHSNGKCGNYKSTQDLSSSEEDHEHRRREKKRYSSAESLSSDADRRKVKENKRHSSSDSEGKHHRTREKSSSKKKKDIDKKRKGKKKKRDRDRSPGYRKHRK